MQLYMGCSLSNDIPLLLILYRLEISVYLSVTYLEHYGCLL